MAAVERAGPQVVHPSQRLQVGDHVALGVGDHRRAAAQDVVADQHGARTPAGRPGGRRCARAWGRRRSSCRPGASRSPGSEHPPAGARRRAAEAAATWAPNRAPHGSAASAWSPWWWVTSTATQRASARGQHLLDRGQVRRVVGPGIDQHRLAAARLADDVGVRAVEGHARGVGRQHPGDQRLERRPSGAIAPGAGSCPCCARVDRDVHDRHASRVAARPRSRRLACTHHAPNPPPCAAAASLPPPPSSCSPPAAAPDDDTSAAEIDRQLLESPAPPRPPRTPRRRPTRSSAPRPRRSRSGSRRAHRREPDPSALGDLFAAGGRGDPGARAPGRARRRLGARSPTAIDAARGGLARSTSPTRRPRRSGSRQVISLQTEYGAGVHQRPDLPGHAVRSVRRRATGVRLARPADPDDAAAARHPSPR